jgi:hypothetical protein
MNYENRSVELTMYAVTNSIRISQIISQERHVEIFTKLFELYNQSCGLEKSLLTSKIEQLIESLKIFITSVEDYD